VGTVHISYVQKQISRANNRNHQPTGNSSKQQHCLVKELITNHVGLTKIHFSSTAAAAKVATAAIDWGTKSLSLSLSLAVNI
jgi:hypothetical protein